MEKDTFKCPQGVPYSEVSLYNLLEDCVGWNGDCARKRETEIGIETLIKVRSMSNRESDIMVLLENDAVSCANDAVTIPSLTSNIGECPLFRGVPYSEVL